MHTLRLVGLMMLALIVAVPSIGRADDDEGNPSIPPVNPGGGYGDIYPNPTLPPYYVPHSNTSPSGVGSIANTQSNSIRLGQSFQATASSLDWVAMVFQYNYQPNSGPMDPASFRIHISSGITTSGDASGELINGLGSTGVKSITPDPLSGDSLGWILFDFPSTVSLTPGNQYYLRIEHTGGYGVDNTGVGVAVGSLGSNAYSAGATWRAIYNQFLNRWEQFAFRNEDLVFSLGATIPALPGDFNIDGDVDGGDFLLWQQGESPGGADALDLTKWQAHFGASFLASASSTAVPEPSTLALLAFMAVGSRRRRTTPRA
ncbi:MAG: PEP-CTERM sorting domain-containing protein [Planctomycetaceae bacterium]|nr:PEP-CTERM sorting domain-containing protein [Planctomycetaceae bacterium]